MAVLQHYYTSFVNKETGSAGFQVKAMSPGISPDAQASISRMIAYRIPPMLDEHNIASHPVALRYYYKGPRECILLCSQSNGTDENGRPGNFFAHSLVMEPDIFTSIPPILYWHSPFWQKEDPVVRKRVDSLPVLTSFDQEPVLDINKVWAFLAQGKRIQQFEKLMSAVVHCKSTQRRVVIIDSIENVTLWIAAVSCMLPSDYRPMLSFATYHHDPYQAQFMIIGTTSDSSFRASPEEYMSYFILNAETDEMSKGEDSPYAKEVAASATPDLYETRLLPLFTDYMHRFPPPTTIDEQLDLIVLYAQLLSPQHPLSLTSDELKAISIALTAFKQLGYYTQDDLNELLRLRNLLWETDKLQQDAVVSTAYNLAMALLRKHKMPTDAYILEELKHFSALLVHQGEVDYVCSRIENLRETYGDELFLKSINGTAYLPYLSQLIEKASPAPLNRVWKYLCPSIQPSEKSRDILLITLRVISTLVNNQRTDDADALLKSMKQAMPTPSETREWLELAVQNNASLPGGALEEFYYFLVSGLELDQRLPYRNLVERAYPKIVSYELTKDVYSSGKQRGLAMLEHWVEHAKRRRYDSVSLVDQGLQELEKLYTDSPQQWSDLAFDLLTNRTLAPLPQEWQGYLLKKGMSGISLSHFSPAHIKLYEQYQNDGALPDETKTVLKAILAMLSGKLDQDLAQRLSYHFRDLGPSAYEAETKKFITEFFKSDVSNESHMLMIRALFNCQCHNWHYHTYFWTAYWEMFTRTLTQPATAEQAVELLSFWFNIRPGPINNRYIIQEFFLNLPTVLDEVRRQRGFYETTRIFNTQAAKQPWYPVVQNFFIERRNVLTSLRQNLVTQFQKFPTGQNVDKEAQIRVAQERERRLQAFDAAIATLFERKKVQEYHVSVIPELFKTPEQSEHFWSSYWEKFVNLFNSRQADQVLEVLSFWFDVAFGEFGRGPYVVQAFFLGLLDAIDQARKQRGFRETANQITEKATKNWQDQYPWYSLVQTAFTEQESRRPGWLRRD